MEYEEVKGDPAIPPEQVWMPQAIDESIEGILEAKEQAQFGFRYWLNTTNGKKCFYGTTVLDSLMAKIEIGKNVKIVYKGQKPATKPNRSPTKIWKVFQDKVVQERVK